MSSLHGGNPLKQLSMQTSAILNDAGWRPGIPRRRGKSPCNGGDSKWLQFAYQFWDDRLKSSLAGLDQELLERSFSARCVLSECFGLELNKHHPSGMVFTAILDPGIGISHAHLCKKLSLELSLICLPIGEELSQAIITLAEDGRVFTIGCVGSGVYLIGNNFDEAIVNILFNNPRVPMSLNDSDLQFDAS